MSLTTPKTGRPNPEMRVLVVALLVGLASTTAAFADERSAAKEHYVKGTKAYELGVYDEAIREYMEAYRIIDDPALLYNLAQAHRFAGHPADALRFYKMFLAKQPRLQNREEVENKIEELTKLIEQQKKSQSMPPETTMKPAEPAPKTEPATTTEVVAPRPGNGKVKLIAGAAVAGVGVVLVGAGIALSVVAKQDSDYLSNLSKTNGTYDPSRSSRGSTLGAVGPALLGVGAVTVVAGTVVAVLGIKDRKAEKRARVSPAGGPGFAGIVVTGQF